MKVYRVEDPVTLEGPYTSGDPDSQMATYRMRDAHLFSFYAHPTPRQSMAHTMGREDKCAMTSMRALFAWFGGFIPGMLREGFQIVVIDTDIVAGPDNTGQVVFADTRKAR